MARSVRRSTRATETVQAGGAVSWVGMEVFLGPVDGAEGYAMMAERRPGTVKVAVTPGA